MDIRTEMARLHAELQKELGGRRIPYTIEGVARVAAALRSIRSRDAVDRETIEHEIQRILDGAPPAMRETFKQIFDKECSHDM